VVIVKRRATLLESGVVTRWWRPAGRAKAAGPVFRGGPAVWDSDAGGRRR
jgi:hypothetical protein